MHKGILFVSSYVGYLTIPEIQWKVKPSIKHRQEVIDQFFLQELQLAHTVSLPLGLSTCLLSIPLCFYLYLLSLVFSFLSLSTETVFKNLLSDNI